MQHDPYGASGSGVLPRGEGHEVVEVSTGSAGNGAASTSAAPGPRRLTRRRSLPGSRAVVGAFLVTAAAVGTFGAYTAANAAPTERYVALTRDIAAGSRIGADDLVVVAAELPAAQQATVLTDLGVAAGAVAVGPLSAGQLLAGSDVVKLDGVVGRAQLSIPVDPARANNGELRRGELVDVIATTTSAGEARSEVVAGDAVVVQVFAGDRSLGSSSSVVVTLSLLEAELVPVADAAAAATISIARVSGLDRRAPESVVLDGRTRGVGGAEAGAGVEPEIEPEAGPPPTATPGGG